jgi:hypothetical protein
MPASLLIAESPDMLPKLKSALVPHAVHAVHGGAQAKLALSSGAFDMVILGAHIDQGGMLEVLRFTASLERCRTTPIVCVRTRELWSPLPGLASTTKALGADALIDFGGYASEAAALAGLARIVNEFLRCGADEPVDQIWISLDSAVAHFGADFGTVQLYDPERRSLRIVAQRNCPARFMAYFESVGNATTSCGTALKRRQRVVVGDVATDPLFAGKDATRVLMDCGIRAMHSTPLFCRPARLRGMLTLHYRDARRPPDAQFAFADVLGRRMAGSLGLM